ncbi:hypothetical protein JTE90_004669 [Oedothorax gibbosus]|uniref:Uncharacterized protein n=1 Tax=Oedothorax gibbosus TaxID=931172 RepID=A0AAV6TFR7_9ARAC|nr:hypothetical protein JTE90_004669 [Oedothorax gibbosus]
MGLEKAPGANESTKGPGEVAAFGIPPSLAGGAHRGPAAFSPLWNGGVLAHTLGPERWGTMPGQDEGPRENLVEVRSGSDVQIDRQTGSSGVRLIEPLVAGFSPRSFPQDSWRSLNSVSSVKNE